MHKASTARTYSATPQDAFPARSRGMYFMVKSEDGVPERYVLHGQEVEGPAPLALAAGSPKSSMIKLRASTFSSSMSGTARLAARSSRALRRSTSRDPLGREATHAAWQRFMSRKLLEAFNW